jgi:hypothetical protein
VGCYGEFRSKEAKVRTNENLAPVAAFTHYQHRRVRSADCEQSFRGGGEEEEVVVKSTPGLRHRVKGVVAVR